MAYKTLTPADLSRAMAPPPRPNWERQLFEPGTEGDLAGSTRTDEQDKLFDAIQELEKKMYNRIHDSS